MDGKDASPELKVAACGELGAGGRHRPDMGLTHEPHLPLIV